MGARWGGGNRLEIYAIATNAASTLVLGIGRGGGGAEADGNIITAAPDWANGICTLTVTHERNNSALWDFIKAANPPGTSAIARPERNANDGLKLGGTTAGAVYYVVILYGGVEDGGTDRQVLTMVASVDPTSGGYSEGFNTASQPKLIFKSVNSLTADVTVAIAKYNTGLVSAPAANITIAKNVGWDVTFEDLP